MKFFNFNINITYRQKYRKYKSLVFLLYTYGTYITRMIH